MAWSQRLALGWLAAVVFVLHLLVMAGHVLSPDEELLYRFSESIALRGSTAVAPLESDPDTALLPEGLPPTATFATVYNPDAGTHHTQYQPLQPLLAVPIIWAARATEGALASWFAAGVGPGMHDAYLPTEGRDAAVYRRGLVLMLFNPLVAALSAVLIARMGRLLTGSRRAGLLAALAWALGTIAWPHSRTFFTEPLAGLLALAAFDQFLRWSMMPLGTARRHAVVAGVCLGLANWTRVDAPLFTVGLVAAFALRGTWKHLREEAWARRRGDWPVLDVLIVGAIALGAWLLLQRFNAIRFGVLDVTGGYRDQSEGVKLSTPLLVGLHGLLFSPGKGMFYFSPALVLGLWGWRRAPCHLRWVGAMALVTWVPFFLVMALWQNWDGGWCWGPRHIVQIHLPIMLGAAFLFTGIVSWWRRAVTAAVMVVGIGVQLLGSSQNPLDYYREYFLTYRDLVYHRLSLREMQVAALQRDFAIHHRRPDGSLGAEVAPGLEFLPAPMIDSLYLPEHSQWATYPEMWRMGYSDLYLLNRLTGRRSPDRWRGEP